MASSGKATNRDEKSREHFPSLVPLGHHAGKPAIVLSRPVMVAGNSKAVRIQLQSDSVSHNHTIFIIDDSGTYVRDLGSRTHTIINGKIVREAWLEDGDTITIGSFVFQYIAPSVGGGARRVPAPVAALDIVGVEIPLPFDGPTALIGRRMGCEVRLTEESVSTSHAVIFEQNGKHHIRDLSSRTGTFVNGRKAHQAELNFGDEILIGETRMSFVPYVPDVEEADQAVAVIDEEPIGLAEPEIEAQEVAPEEPISTDEVETADEVEVEEAAPIQPRDIAARDLDAPRIEAPGTTSTVETEPSEIDLADEEPVIPVARRTPISPRSIDVPSEYEPPAPWPISETKDEEPVIDDELRAVPLDEAPPPPAKAPVALPQDDALEDALEEVETEPPAADLDDTAIAEEESVETQPTEDDLLDVLSNDAPPIEIDEAPTAKRAPIEVEETLVDDEAAVEPQISEVEARVEAPKPVEPEPAISSEMDRLLKSLNEAANRPLDPEIAELENRPHSDLPTEEVDLKVDDPLANVPEPISALARRARAIADLLDVNEDIEQAAEEESKAIAEILSPTDEIKEPAEVVEPQPVEEAEAPEDLVLDAPAPVAPETFESHSIPVVDELAEEFRVAVDVPLIAHDEIEVKPPSLHDLEKPAIAIDHGDELQPLIESLETPLAGAIEAASEEPPAYEAHTGPEDDELEPVTLENLPPIEESLREPVPLDEVEAPVDETDLAPADRADEVASEPLVAAMDVDLGEPEGVADESPPSTSDHTAVAADDDLVDLIVESLEPPVAQATSIEPAAPTLESVMDLAEIDHPISTAQTPVEPAAEVAEPLADAPAPLEPAQADVDEVVEPKIETVEPKPAEIVEEKIEAKPQKKSPRDAWDEATSFASQATAPRQPAPKPPAPPKRDEPKLEGWDDLPDGDLTDSLMPGTGGFVLGGTSGSCADTNFLNLGGIGFIGDESDEYEPIPGGMPLPSDALSDKPRPVPADKTRPSSRRRRRTVEPKADGTGETVIEPPAVPKAETPDWPELETNEIEEPTFPAPPTPTLRAPTTPIKPAEPTPVDRSEGDAPTAPTPVIPPRPNRSKPESGTGRRRNRGVTPGAMAYPPAASRPTTDVFSHAPVAGLDEMLSRLPRPDAGTTDQPAENITLENPSRSDASTHDEIDDDDIDNDPGPPSGLSEPAARREEPRRSMIPKIVVPENAQHVAEVDPGELVEDANYSEPTDPNAPGTPTRRRAIRQVPLVVLAMFVMIGAAMAAIYQFVPVPALARAEFRFNDLSVVPEEVRRSFINDQKDRLTSVREPATGRLPAGVTPGFLQSGSTLEPVVQSIDFVRGRVDSVDIKVKSDIRHLREDAQRLKALADALYERNQDIRKNYEITSGRLGQIDMTLSKKISESERLGEEVSRLDAIFRERPGAIELRDFERARNEAESRVADTRAAIGRQQAEIARLEQLLLDAEKAASAQTSDTGETDSVLTELEAQIARETQALSELSGPVQASEDARAQLESALDAFATEVDTARQSIADQPDVVAYIDDAQKLLANIRERTDLMSRRQEQQLTRLAEFRKQLSELTDDQQIARENSDRQLSELRDQLAFQQRMLNVAEEQNATDSINEISARIKLLESGIAARLELLADPRVTALKQKLEEMIQAAEREMTADRTGNEKFLSDMTTAFIARQPAIEKLPNDQKRLAQNLADRLAAITLARQSYSRALDDSSSADQSRRIAIKTRIEQLKLAVADRQDEINNARASAAELASKVESTRASLESARTTLVDLEQMNAKNELDFEIAANTLREAEQRRNMADLAVPEYDSKRTRWLELRKQIESDKRELQTVKATLSNGILPMPIADDAISTEEGTDNRLLIASLASLVIVALGIGYLFMLLGRVSRQGDEYATAPAAQGMTALRA